MVNVAGSPMGEHRLGPRGLSRCSPVGGDEVLDSGQARLVHLKIVGRCPPQHPNPTRLHSGRLTLSG